MQQLDNTFQLKFPLKLLDLVVDAMILKSGSLDRAVRGRKQKSWTPSFIFVRIFDRRIIINFKFSRGTLFGKLLWTG